MTSTVNLTSGFMHKSGFGKCVVPHPGAANRLLRKGLTAQDGINLNFRHEFSQLQTLPLALVYAGVLLTVSLNLPLWIRIFIAVISSQAAWEMIAGFFERSLAVVLTSSPDLWVPAMCPR